MLNVVAIMGRLVADPELRTTTQGNSVCSFRIACDRSYVQTRQYQDKQGSKRTAVEVVANNISFAGAKRQDGQNVPSYEQQTASYVEQAKAQTSFAQGSADDFAVIDDNDDLPF